MSNMSYCRFENTARDLSDCLENLHNNLNGNEHEIRARKRLVGLCKQILQDVGVEVDMAKEPEFDEDN